MKFDYVKTIGFRKFNKVFETELYDITKVTGKNRSGKSNLLYAIINILLGTNLSGDDKTCLINKNCDSSYGELHFTDNMGVKHILVRGKHRYDNNKNFISLDGNIITQKDLISFYKDKKLFLSILNPLYFLSKKSVEQKEMVDKYLSDIQPKVIFDSLTKQQQDILVEEYFSIPIKDVYPNLSIEELENIYNEKNLQAITGKCFAEIVPNDRWHTICENVKTLKGSKYYDMLPPEEQENFINANMINICMNIAYINLSLEEQNLLEGIPYNIPTYISELNDDIKKYQKNISILDGKIEYAQNIANEELPNVKTFEKEVDLSLARQELAFLNTNQDIVDKEKQKQIVENLERDILNKETEIKELEKSMQEGKKKYISIKNGEACNCPTCGQHIENISKSKTIENMRITLTNDFNKKTLLETQKKDMDFTLVMERCKYHALEGESTIEKNKQISVIEQNIKQLENEQLDIQKFNNEIAIKEKNIKNAKSDIIKFNKEKQIQNNYIDNLNQSKKVAQKLYISYIEEKMKVAKQYLKDVDIKFYSVLKGTGEIKEDFLITYKGTPLSDLSKSETIATALEFANMFNKITKVNSPIFIDDYESYADYDFIKEYSNNTQLIVAKVEKGNLLKITDYNNLDSYSVIKHIIKGAKTINTYTSVANNIQKAV